MSKVCEICGKRPVTGCNVSHANNHTRIIVQKAEILKSSPLILEKCAQQALHPQAFLCLRGFSSVASGFSPQ
ncbi:MAG: 50S ribosomal protein L28 [Deltaproteobacteria bacterium]|nr:50S ribosomal protein L28 [Deltaproteobacteria bacterium]